MHRVGSLVQGGLDVVTGAVIFVALRLVHLVQSALGIQRRARGLSDDERALLHPIFRESLRYDRIGIVEGRAGLLTMSGRALTIGFTIYLPTFASRTLVHECVHVWQFESRGRRYIGNSALNQLASVTIRRGWSPYNWRPPMDAGDSWPQLASVEAQAAFVEQVYATGTFERSASPAHHDDTPGAFFRDDDSGRNSFWDGGRDYTDQANVAWRTIRT